MTPVRSTPIWASLIVLALILVPVFLLGGSGGDAIAALPDRRADLEVAPEKAVIDLGVASYQVYRNPDSRHWLAVRLIANDGEMMAVAYYQALDHGTHTYLKMTSPPRYADTYAEGQFRLALLQAVINDRALDAALR